MIHIRMNDSGLESRDYMTNEQLIEMAYEAMEMAYVPYSKFQVGAALLTKDGTVIKGCNVENASFGATNCAERTAIFKAISEGHKDFVKIAVVSSSKKYTFPCGICRQVISEFTMDASMVFHDETNGIIEVPMTDILPYRFDQLDD